MVRRSGPALGALLLGALWVSACGVKDLDFTYAAAGGSGHGGAQGSGNAAPGGDGSAGEPDVPLTCRAGQKRCLDDTTPEVCTPEGDWLAGKPCSGRNKVCTGAGVCAPYLLVNAGIDGLGVRPKESKLVLKRQTLSSYGRSCGKSGKCVTGGIQ